VKIFPFAIAVCMAQAQTPATPVFEVASLRLTQHGRGPDGWSYSDAGIKSPGTFAAVNSSLDELIRWAYNVKDYQVSGPEWRNDDAACYDITAKFPPDSAREQVRLMLQALLAERLKVAAHKEMRTLAGYELVVARNGPKELQPSAQGSRTSTWSRGGDVTATHVSMTEWAYQLSRYTKQVVFDKTGIPGYFDFKLNYSPRLGEESDTHPSLFLALQEQLGLKLEPAKVPVEVVVVDHAERVPTEN
jgi:uncharacterized protein (TIGR03435 family)